MGLVATTLVSETAVHARFSDRPDLTAATQWFEFQVPLAELDIVEPRPVHPRNSQTRFISAAKLAALRHLYKMIGAEIVRLQDELRKPE
ncbi:hypothetical protein PQJ75_30005 [Rhodoplanes sp. TEM]|uniref:Uncharacterized protein n=1 Tax=Rhodoplanes tepidamans TaxID=200616 RepID=A0ABT5J8X1_RHOTP|nr:MULTISPECIES: hypothetical protein [Rhodoplanes]MDC7785917.1 hypothetical protein [Rhodoplanes tepidamans]MDC7987988.1 hypothetical protein [Rhodoplanes sp. TEM]MDQ0355464.1 hypothetical protein [Rhodoplanes tepidamans]